MKDIKLFKPIVLRSSLDDMTLSQKEIAIDLLTNCKSLVPGKDGLRYVSDRDTKQKHVKHALFGSEAVCYYRQSLGLPDVSISTICVDEILTSPKDFDTLYDILYLLNRVHMRNERLIKVVELGCPQIIFKNEYRMLQGYVETLQDNNWCGNPVINCFDAPDLDEDAEPGKYKHYEVVRKSLADIGYSLQNYKDLDDETYMD